jgi:transcriptional regulator with XRE-family HTH domain
MADRTQIREFLTTRRARITPEQAGLPVYGGSRRVAGLRREEVALLAGVSVDYYNKLERGNLAGVSESVLDALSRALQLTEAERDHLYDLARSASTRGVPVGRRHRPSARRVRPGLQLVLDAITEAPADLRNGRRDVLASNRLGRALYCTTPSPATLTSDSRLCNSPATPGSRWSSTPPSPARPPQRPCSSWPAGQIRSAPRGPEDRLSPEVLPRDVAAGRRSQEAIASAMCEGCSRTPWGSRP